MRVAAIQFDIVWEDKHANHQLIESALDEASIEPGTFVLLPELADTGFSLNVDAIVDERSLDWARRTARQRRIWLQHGFPVHGSDGLGRNRAVIISPQGDVIGGYEKLHPFSYAREIDYYRGGDTLLVRRLNDIAGQPVVSPVICYDLRFPEMWRLVARAGAEVFTIGASWPNARQHHWRSLLIARAIENQSCVIAVNRVGSDPHLDYDGGSMIIGPMGNVLAEADDRPTVIQADLDLPGLRDWRAKFPALKDIRADLLGHLSIDTNL